MRKFYPEWSPIGSAMRCGLEKQDEIPTAVCVCERDGRDKRDKNENGVGNKSTDNNMTSACQTEGSRQQAAGSRQQAAGSRQQATGSRQQAAGSMCTKRREMGRR
jgi:uncharacterized protein YjbJ (UPF0337 family)